MSPNLSPIERQMAGIAWSFGTESKRLHLGSSHLANRGIDSTVWTDRENRHGRILVHAGKRSTHFRVREKLEWTSKILRI